MQVTPELNREPLFGQGHSHPSVRCCALRLTDSRLIITRAQRATPRSTWQSVPKRIHLQNCGKGSPPRSVATRDGWGTGEGVHIQQRGHKGRCILGFILLPKVDSLVGVREIMTTDDRGRIRSGCVSGEMKLFAGRR